MDHITIKGLDIYANHGVYPEEKRLGQHFLVDALLYADLARAGHTDELKDATDYGAVCRKIAEVMTEGSLNLIEAAAEKTAREVLLAFPLIEEVELTIHKPQAPVGMSFQDIAVTIRRGWHTAYVALGSNLGDRRAYLEAAITGLSEDPLCRLVCQAPIYETAPYGGVEQGDYLNSAVCIRTLREPRALLGHLQEMEQRADRKRTVRWGPRTLDLDLLLYDDRVIDEPGLIVPHPDMANRDFVLAPMCDIAPHVRHPLTGRTMEEMYRQLRDKQGTELTGVRPVAETE